MVTNFATSLADRSKVLRAVACFGDRYSREFLSCTYLKRESLEKDWWGGLQLFLGHSFHQGRTDEVSEKVRRAAMPVLSLYFEKEDPDRIRFTDFGQLKADLGAKIGKRKIGKGRDVEMLVSIFEFVSLLHEKNLTLYGLGKLRGGGLADHYRELQGIRQIGPKVASFYLRDLVCIYDIHGLLQPDDLRFLQPIDVWVRRVAQRLGIITAENCPDDEVRQHIIDACKQCGVSAFKFNQGAWYLGKNAFRILVEQLEKVIPDEQG
jgi:hypothetical protein